jgi:hypothetical protein
MALLIDVLEHALPELLDTVPPDIRRNTRFMHDGAPAYFSYATRNYLETAYTGRWVERRGPVAWQSSSPDMDHHDFFSFGDIYKIWCTLPRWILQRLYLGPQHSWHFSVMHRLAEACVTMQIQHFEYLL